MLTNVHINIDININVSINKQLDQLGPAADRSIEKLTNLKSLHHRTLEPDSRQQIDRQHGRPLLPPASPLPPAYLLPIMPVMNFMIL